MPTIHANGIDIYYEHKGSGPRLLYFQGSGQTLAKSGVMVDGWAKNFEVVAHDQRGLGQTEIPPGPYEMADYAADAAALLDAVGWDSCRVGRHQLRRHGGAGVRGHLARAGRAPRARVHLTRWRLRVVSAAHPRRPPARRGEGAGRDAARRSLHARVPRRARRRPRARRHDRRRCRARRRVRRGAARRAARSSTPAAASTCSTGSANITCPTLVQAGKYDHIAPPANAEVIAEHIPNAELRLYEGGHIFFLQDPQAVPDAMEFLAAD